MNGYAFVGMLLVVVLEIAIFNAVEGNFEQIVCSLLFLSYAALNVAHNTSTEVQIRLTFGLLCDIRKAIASSINDPERRDQFISDGEHTLRKTETEIDPITDSLREETRSDAMIALVAIVNILRVLVF